MNAVASFNKNQLMTVLLATKVQVNLVDEKKIVMAAIRKPVGSRPRYLVVFEEGRDTEKTRFFYTDSGAKSYYEFLIGAPGARQGNSDVWGHKSFEELKHMIEGVGRGQTM
jgi:hypothetical protein